MGTFSVVFTKNFGSSGVLSNVPMDETNLFGLGLASSNIDARLIYLESIGTTHSIIDIRGNNPRTSASDIAVDSLINTYENEIWEDE